MIIKKTRKFEVKEQPQVVDAWSRVLINMARA